jgi:hypothetical protein
VDGSGAGTDAREPWDVVVVGGAEQPSIHQAGHENVNPPKEIISYGSMASGSVAGVPWSLTGFLAKGRGSHEVGGPCAELLLGADGAGGGTAACWEAFPKDSGLSTSSDIRMSFLYSGDDPSFVAYFGLVSSRVAGMQLQLSDGDVKVIDIVPGAEGPRCWVLRLLPVS